MLQAAGPSGATVVVPGLEPYTEYRLQVAAVSGQQEGQRSQPVVNRTAAGVPEPPTVTQVHSPPPHTHTQLTADR